MKKKQATKFILVACFSFKVNMQLLSTPIYQAAPSGLKSDYTLDFNIDSVFVLPLNGSFQGIGVNAQAIFVDNSSNAYSISVAAQNNTQIIQPLMSGYLDCRGLANITFSCENKTQIPIIIYSDAKTPGFMTTGILTENIISDFVAGEDLQLGDVAVLGPDNLIYWGETSNKVLSFARPVYNAATDYMQPLASSFTDGGIISLYEQKTGSLCKSITVSNILFSFEKRFGGIHVDKYNSDMVIINSYTISEIGLINFSVSEYDGKILLSYTGNNKLQVCIYDTNFNLISINIFASSGSCGKAIISHDGNVLGLFQNGATLILEKRAIGNDAISLWSYVFTLGSSTAINFSGIDLNEVDPSQNYFVVAYPKVETALYSSFRIAKIGQTGNLITDIDWTGQVINPSPVNFNVEILVNKFYPAIPAAFVTSISGGPCAAILIETSAQKVFSTAPNSLKIKWTAFNRICAFLGESTYIKAYELDLSAGLNQLHVVTVSSTVNDQGANGVYLDSLLNSDGSFDVFWQNAANAEFNYALVNSICSSVTLREVKSAAANVGSCMGVCIFVNENTPEIGSSIFMNISNNITPGSESMIKYFFHSKVNSCTPIGVINANALKGSTVHVKIKGPNKTRRIFSPPVNYDANGLTPPGQKMTLAGNVALLLGIQ